MPIITHEERVGTLLAEKYRLASILGRGGMGAVFAARHEWTGRGVAIKLLNHDLASDPQMAERFLREARTAATLKHPNVVDVLDMGRAEDGSVYLALELLDGAPLTDHLAERPLEPSIAYALLTPVMRALAHAHRRGVIHRDLKPDNIFISLDVDGHTIPKLLDFGIAKIVESETSVTRTGMLLGTPDYMSPEQARALSDIGPATDVWSMGVVWYECLTGALPFDEGSPSALVIKIATTHAPSIRERLPALHPALIDAIDRALSNDRDQRYPDMRAFLDAMLEAASRAGIATSDRPSIDASVPLPQPRSSRNNTALSTLPTSIASSSSASTVADEVQPSTPRAAKPDDTSKAPTRMSWSGAAPSTSGERRRVQPFILVAGAVAVSIAIAGGLYAMKSRSGPAGSPVPPTTAATSPTSATSTPAIATPSPAPAIAPPSAPTPAVTDAPTTPIAATSPSVTAPTTANDPHHRSGAAHAVANAHAPIAIVPLAPSQAPPAAPTTPSAPVANPVAPTTAPHPTASGHHNAPTHPFAGGANTPLPDYE